MHITIRREGMLLGEIKERIHPNINRYRYRKIPDGTARVISPNLAIYEYYKRTAYDSPWYHVIHIPTGLVIAAVEYQLVSSVKKTFESEQWTLVGENTLKTIPRHTKNTLGFKSLEFEMTCLIRYEIIKE